MKLLFSFYLILCFIPAFYAQQDAWVYFSDKGDVEYSIQNPLTILSQKAIDRRGTQNIPIDVTDVPLNREYLNILKSSNGITVLASSKWLNAVHVRGEVEAIRALSKMEFVQTIDFASHNLNNTARSSIADDKFTVEATLVDYNYGKAQNQVEMLHINALHQQGYTGEDIIIAVLDAGFPNVDSMDAFEKLRGGNRLLGGFDFVERSPNIYNIAASNHGTKVLSTMAGFIENEFVGTAPEASYYLFRTESDAYENPVEESFWVEAAERADSLGVHIINSSLGYNTFDDINYNYQPSDMNGKTTFISRGAAMASKKGILVVNSAGNTGNVAWQTVTAPADASGVFTVGAVKADGSYAPFSSQGNNIQPTQKPDVVAQGFGAVVIDSNGTIVTNNGTSFSAPITAGALACLWQALPNAIAEEIKTFARISASQYTDPDDLLGYGIPNFDLALSLGLGLNEVNVSSFKLFPNPVMDKLHIRCAFPEEKGSLHIYNILGKLVMKQSNSDFNNSVDVAQLGAGVYILSIISRNKTFNLKFIKS